MVHADTKDIKQGYDNNINQAIETSSVCLIKFQKLIFLLYRSQTK